MRPGSRTSLTCSVFGAIVSTTASLAAQVAQPASLDLADVWVVWQERHDALKSFEVKWSHSLTVLGDRRVARDRQTANPPGETVVLPQAVCLMLVDGERVRYESIGASFVGEMDGSPVPRTSAFDGELQQYLSAIASEPHEHQWGGLDHPPQFDEWDNVHLLPLVFSLRPLRDEAFGSDWRQWRVQQQRTVLDGRPCAIIASRLTDAPIERAAWIDLERDYVPLRVTSSVDGQVTGRLDIEYGHDPGAGWVPRHWTSSLLTSRGKLLERSDNSLISLALDPDLSADRFRISFPPGTRVTDKREGGRQFVVDSRGKLVPLSLGPDQGWWPSSAMIFGLLGLAGAILISVWFWLGRRTAS